MSNHIQQKETGGSTNKETAVGKMLAQRTSSCAEVDQTID